MRSVYVLLLTFAVAIANDNLKKSSSCREPAIFQNFNLRGVMGHWYQYSNYHHKFEAGCDCLTLEGVLIGTDSIQLTNCCQFSGVSNDTQECGIGVTQAILTNPEKKEAYFKYLRAGSSIESDAWIIDTDYVNYLIVNGCDRVDDEEKDVLWIYSRDKEINETEMKKINKALKDNNFEKSKIVKQRHGADVCTSKPPKMRKNVHSHDHGKHQ